MVSGINFITDEKGKATGIILDLLAFKKDNIKASEVLDSLAGLQQLIDQAGFDNNKANNWALAKEKLKNL